MLDLRSNLRITLAGRLLYRLISLRRDIAINNINRVFKNTLSASEKTKLLKAFYSHLATLLKETLLMLYLSPKQLDKRIGLRGIDHLRTAIKHNRGVFLLCGHMGNWEISALGLSSVLPLVGELHVIRRPLHTKWLERLLFRKTKSFGISIIDSRGALLKVKQAVKNKETIAFTMDQHAAVDNKTGIAVDFFGHKAGTYRGLALFVQKYKTPVIPLCTYRDAHGKHIIQFLPQLIWEDNPDNELAIHVNTLKYNQALEEMILRHPEQWWWVHRRWKLGS